MSENQFGKQGWTPERIDHLKGKTILITGANSGTGYEAAKILLEKEAQVIMLNRNETKSQKAISDIKAGLRKDVNISFIKMNLSDLASVRNAANEVIQKVPKIDALICNAAIAQVPNQQFTKDGFESHLGVNHYGHFLLCGMLFDKINASDGRIVVVASEGYKMGIKTIQFDDMNWDKNYHPMNTYCHSKLAQMMFAYELQDKIKESKSNVGVYVCHPGASSTSLIKNSGGFRDRLIWGIMKRTPLVQSAKKGSYPEIMCATEDNANLDPKAYYGPTKRMHTGGPVGRCQLASHAQDKSVMTKLWEVSEKATNYKWSF